MSITILGIESSCDDTSAAVIADGVLLSNVIASQQVHKLPPEALIFDSVPEGDQILPDLIAAGNAVV